MRLKYMTLSFRGNIVITLFEDKGVLRDITCEQAIYGGFNTAIFNCDGTLRSNSGFSASDIAFLTMFVAKNLATMMYFVEERD